MGDGLFPLVFEQNKKENQDQNDLVPREVVEEEP